MEFFYHFIIIINTGGEQTFWKHNLCRKCLLCQRPSIYLWNFFCPFLHCTLRWIRKTTKGRKRRKKCKSKE